VRGEGPGRGISRGLMRCELLVYGNGRFAPKWLEWGEFLIFAAPITNGGNAQEAVFAELNWPPDATRTRFVRHIHSLVFLASRGSVHMS
jgi:hypothetical protein